MPGYNKDTAPHYRPSRDGMKTVVAYVPQGLSDAMRHLAIDEKTTMQALCNEAFLMLLKQRKVKVSEENTKLARQA